MVAQQGNDVDAPALVNNAPALNEDNADDALFDAQEEEASNALVAVGGGSSEWGATSGGRQDKNKG